MLCQWRFVNFFIDLTYSGFSCPSALEFVGDGISEDVGVWSLIEDCYCYDKAITAVTERCLQYLKE